MTKKELVKAVARDGGLSQEEARMAVEAFTDNIVKHLAAGDRIVLRGFGEFRLHNGKVKFQASKSFAESL